MGQSKERVGQSAKVARLVRKSQSQIAGLLQKQAKERLVRRPPAASPPRSSRTAEEQHTFRRLRGGSAAKEIREDRNITCVQRRRRWWQQRRRSPRSPWRRRRSSCGANFMPWSTRVRFATFCCRPRKVPSGEGSGRVTPSTTGGAATRCASPGGRSSAGKQPAALEPPRLNASHSVCACARAGGAST